MGSVHESVMPREVLDHLHAQQAGKYLDCTLGGAGHTRLILEQNQDNQVYAIDRDPLAVKRARALEAEFPNRFFVEQASFAEVDQVYDVKFDGILADFGISSDQLLVGRGFSFNDETSLDMRMDTTQGMSAAELIDVSSKSDLVRIFKRGGVKGDLNAIANSVMRHRPFTTAKSLADAVDLAVRKSTNSQKKIHPATLVFQAIRIEVNQEFQQIESFLDASRQLIVSGGRLVVISFHSLEDQLVTKRFRKWSTSDTKPALWAGPQGKQQAAVLGKLITKSAVKPSEAEVLENSRSRSAKLRSFIFN